MEHVKLGKIIKVQKGKKHELATDISQNSVRFIQIDDLRNDNNLKYTNDKKGVHANLNDLLIAWDGANAGTIGFGKKGFIGSTIALLRINETDKYDSIFLGFLLKNHREFLKQTSTGATIPHINRSALDSIKIPNFTIQYQQKIANILLKAEALIEKRKKTLKLLDEFLISTFLDVFGDPVSNPKGWDIVKMSDVITDIESGTSYRGTENKELEPNELGVLKISAVTSGVFKPNEFKAVNSALITKRVITCQKGMFLISRANTKELIAACCIVPKDYPSLFLPDKLWSLSINEQISNKVFLNILFKIESFRDIIREKASGGHASMLNISMKKFLSLKLPIPKLSIQTQFAKIVEKVEGIKQQQETSFKEIENLYNSLMQRGFKGELALGEIELDEIDEVFDGGFITEEEAQPVKDVLKTDMISYINSLPPIKSKDKNLIKKIRDLDFQKKQAGKIEFDEDYAVYRVLEPHFSKEDSKSLTFPQIFELLKDFTNINYDGVKEFIFNDLSEKKTYFEQIYKENHKDKIYQIELKLKL